MAGAHMFNLTLRGGGMGRQVHFWPKLLTSLSDRSKCVVFNETTASPETRNL